MSKHAGGRRRRHRRTHEPSRPGSPPGTLVTPPGAPKPRIQVIGYGKDDYVEQKVDDLAALSAMRQKWPVLWVNVDGLGDADTIAHIGRLFDLHPLALEDVLNTRQRPKVEAYKSSLFVVMRMVSSLGDGGPEGEQVSLFLGPGFVVTFQERPGDPLDPVRRRIREGRPQMRESGADYLAYAIIDAVVDHYFPLLERFGEHLDELEEEAVWHADRQTIRKIHASRRNLITVRRAIWPLREAVASLIRDANPLVTDETRVYLRDAHDHVLRIVDLIENDRDITASLMDVYLSSVSNKMNEVMKVLTIIATIFIPLTFIVGVYGMNFDPAVSPWNMPELKWRYGYPASLAVMAVIAVIMVFYFRRKGWIGQPSVPEPEPDAESEEAAAPPPTDRS